VIRLLAIVVRYLHYTIGITTPRPDQERMFIAIWLAASLLIIAVTTGFFFLLLAIIHSS
jgi:hypothetical protein